MERVVVFGRGGAGKSTFSRDLGDATGLPVIELDKIYRGSDLRALSAEEWVERQGRVVVEPSWILDGDLDPCDATAPRLERADTVVILGTPREVSSWLHEIRRLADTLTTDEAI